jgi:segregation and condensation protein A
MALKLQLQDFSGPLDLLLYMVGKAKIDIKDIFVSQITDQYIRFVQDAQQLDMDDASAFIQMAATLLEIKSRSMLPKPPPPEEEDPQTLLIRQLEEYAIFKQIAYDMQGFEKAAALVYEKLPEEYTLPPPSFEIAGLTMEGLIAALRRVLSRTPKEELDSPEMLSRHIMRDEYRVPECMLSIVHRLKRGSLSFDALLSEHPSREEVVTFFLALLELLRLGRVQAVQDNNYGDILLSKGKVSQHEHSGSGEHH